MNYDVSAVIKSTRQFLRKNYLTFIFITAVIFISLLNSILYTQIKLLSLQNNQVIHSYRVIKKTNKILLDEYSAKSLALDFLKTGNENALLKVNTINIAISREYESAKSLNLDNEEQLIRFNLLKPLIDELNKTIMHAIQLKTSGKLNIADEKYFRTQGDEQTNDIKLAIENIIAAESNLLENHTAIAQDSLDDTLTLVTLDSIFNFLVLTLIMFVFNKQLSKQMQSNKTVDNNTDYLLKGIINGTKDFILALNLDYKFIAFNKSLKNEFKKIYGMKITLGMSIQEAMQSMPKDARIATELWTRALKGEEFTVIGAFGNPELLRNQYEISYSSIYNENGKLIGASCLARNISKRVKSEKAAALAKEVAENAFKALKEHDESIFLINEMSNILQSSVSLEEALNVISNYCARLLPYTAGVLYVLNPTYNYLESLSDWNNPDMHERIIFSEQCLGLRQSKIYRYFNASKNILCKHVTGKSNVPYYLCIPLLGQQKIIGLLYMELRISKSIKEDELNQFIDQHELLINTLASNIAIAIVDIRLRDDLKIKSLRDPLTGLYNRHYLTESLDNDIQRAKDKKIQLAIIMMDLDNFKQINDTLGHEVGDYVLKELGKLILQNTRKSDIACRYGGEEILLMYYDVSQDDALKATEKLRIEISQMNLIFGSQDIGKITASFGISMYPGDGEAADELISAADIALYQSKKSGRNKITLYLNIND